ncbi:MAG: ACT domain-containing protein [Candidatus Hodarchaeales archaeon]|jgi:hypothetical protein
MKDFTLILKNQPGTFADLGEALGKAGINMEGICGMPCEGEGLIHVLVKDAIATRKVLEEANIEIRAERDVFVLDIGHKVSKPGTGGELARKLANAGVNIDLIYFGENNKLILGVDDLEKARSAL